MNWIWLVDWHFDRVRHGFVHCVGDRLVDGHRDWVGTINRDFDWIWNWFLYWIRDMLFHWNSHWIGLRNRIFLGQGDRLDGFVVHSMAMMVTEEATVQSVAKTYAVPKVMDKTSLLLLPVFLFYCLFLFGLFRFFCLLLIVLFLFLFCCLFFLFCLFVFGFSVFGRCQYGQSQKEDPNCDLHVKM